MFSGQVWL